MKHTFLNVWQKIIAFFTTIFMFFSGLIAGSEPEKVYPANNTVGAYDAAAADYTLAIDAQQDCISTLSGKLGRLDGVSVKAVYATK